MKSSRYFALLFVLLSVFGSAPYLWAQGTDLGTIRGTVTDVSGALIPNAKVVILDLATNTPHETLTNARGEYQVFGLRPGNYKVSIGAPGMNTQDITGLVLTGSDVLSANAVLKLSGGHEQVVVTAEAAAINTEDQTISDTIASREVIDLPRDSRDVYSFLYLNPNITQGNDAGEFKFLGFQSYGANFALDGQRSNNAIFGSPTNSEPSLEAVGEVNVLSNDFSSEYAGISNIRITTKRGGSQFHGSAFYNNKNSALAAWQIQDLQGKQDFVPNQFVTKFPTPYFNEN
ncbi:MAG TPA: carboxypeptidase-like regulatory domain-containing protein, partial [Candidatus Sulfotelmatobacter sp.]|nr:carboxypeptidase-like regulatory domain-containing protein [Candidatus Sulfotelmatobacter sp.]